MTDREWMQNIEAQIKDDRKLRMTARKFCMTTDHQWEDNVCKRCKKWKGVR